MIRETGHEPFERDTECWRDVVRTARNASREERPFGYRGLTLLEAVHPRFESAHPPVEARARHTNQGVGLIDLTVHFAKLLSHLVAKGREIIPDGGSRLQSELDAPLNVLRDDVEVSLDFVEIVRMHRDAGLYPRSPSASTLERACITE
jgi:hypothetical protein